MGQIHTFNHSTSLFKYKNKKNSNTKKIFKDIIVKKSTHKDRKSRAGSNHSKILGWVVTSLHDPPELNRRASGKRKRREEHPSDMSSTYIWKPWGSGCGQEKSRAQSLPKTRDSGIDVKERVGGAGPWARREQSVHERPEDSDNREGKKCRKTSLHSSMLHLHPELPSHTSCPWWVSLQLGQRTQGWGPRRQTEGAGAHHLCRTNQKPQQSLCKSGWLGFPGLINPKRAAPVLQQDVKIYLQP